MADDRNANVVLNADVSGYQQGVAQATQDTNRLAAAVDVVAGKLDGLSKRAGRKLELFGGGVFAGLGAATADAAQFEKQLQTLSATAVVTGQNFGKLRGNVSELVRQFPIARGEAVALVSTITNMGVTSTRQIDQMSKTFTKLSIATGESSQALAAGLIQVSRQMGTLSSGTMSQYANSLLTVSRQSGVAAGGVLNFAQSIAPASRAAGLSQQQVLGVATAFTKAGADGYAAANTFNSILNDITREVTSGSPEIAKYANLIGTTSDNLRQMDKGEALTQIFEAINRQGPQAIQTLDRLGFDGVRAVQAITAVSQSGGLRQAINTATGSYAAGTGILDESSQKAISGFTDQLLILKNNFAQAGAAIGQTFLPPLTKALEITNSMASKVAFLGEGLGKIAGLGGFGVGTLALVGGAALTTARISSILATASAVGRSGPVEGFRAGSRSAQALARGELPDRATDRRYLDRATAGQLRWWQAPFFNMGSAYGAERAREGSGAFNRYAGGILTAPFRLGRGLIDAQTEFYRNAPRSSLDRTAPFLGGIGTLASGIGAGIRNPREFVAGFRSDVSGITDVGKQAKSAEDFGQQLRVGTRGLLERTRAENDGIKVTKQVAMESGKLAKAFAAMTVAQAGAGLRIGGRLAGRGALGAAAMLGLDSPVGIGLAAAGAIGATAYTQGKASDASVDNRIGDVAPIAKYNAALGISTGELGTFADALKTATKALPSVSQMSDVETVSDAVAQLANTRGRKLVQPDVGLIGNNPSAQAAFMQLQGINNPRQVQLAQADIAQAAGGGAIGTHAAQLATDEFMARRQNNQGINYDALAAAVQSKGYESGSAWLQLRQEAFTGPRVGGQQGNLTADIFNSIQQNANENTSQFGQKYAAQVQFNQTQGYLGAALAQAARRQGTAGYGTARAAVRAYEKETGSDFDFGKGDIGQIQKELGPNATDQQYADWFYRNKVRGSSNKGAQAYVGQLNNLGVQTTGNYAGMSLDQLKADSSVTEPIRAQGMFGQFLVGNSKGVGGSNTVQMAVDNYQDPGKQYAGVQEVLRKAHDLGGSFADTDRKLQEMKAAIGDSSNALYGLVSAAQAQAEQQRQFQKPFQNRMQNFASDLGFVRTVQGENPETPDHPARAENAKQMLQSDKENLYDYMKTLVQAEKNFSIQMKRSQQDMTTTIYRSDRDFRISMEQGAQDYYTSRMRSERDFAISMKQSQEDFNIQRARSQRDFDKMMARSAEDAAKAIYDPYKRISSQYTTDAGTLSQNLGDQNRRIQQQTQQLKQIRQMGISQQAIQTLDLANPQNAQELNRLIETLASNPQLIRQINAQVAQRAAATKALTQNPDNTDFMRAVADYKQQVRDSESDMERSTARARNAEARAMSDMATDYMRNVHRAEDAHARAMKDMASDYALQMTRSREDLARMSEQLSGNMSQMFATAVSLITQNLGKLGSATIDELQKIKKAFPELFDGSFIDDILSASNPGAMAQRAAKANQLTRRNAAGGIAMTQQEGIIAERGPEAIIPLNASGASFMAQVYADLSGSMLKNSRTASMPGGMGLNPSTVNYDASTRFEGDITVVAEDPNKMARLLEEKARIAKLTRPGRQTA